MELAFAQLDRLRSHWTNESAIRLAVCLDNSEWPIFCHRCAFADKMLIIKIVNKSWQLTWRRIAADALPHGISILTRKKQFKRGDQNVFLNSERKLNFNEALIETDLFVPDNGVALLPSLQRCRIYVAALGPKNPFILLHLSAAADRYSSAVMHNIRHTSHPIHSE